MRDFLKGGPTADSKCKGVGGLILVVPTELWEGSMLAPGGIDPPST